MLPNEAIEEFQETYKKVFKQEITFEEAKRRAENLFGIFDAVYGSSENKKS